MFERVLCKKNWCVIPILSHTQGERDFVNAKEKLYKKLKEIKLKGKDLKKKR